MRRAVVFLFCSCIFSITAHSNEIDYNNCFSIEEVIEKETREIAHTHPTDHSELAELYVSRGESYLLNEQYEKAIEDFRKANFYLGYFQNMEAASVIAFRAAFGDVVSYDNLGMQEQAQKALDQLKILVEHVGCSDCIENNPCDGKVFSSGMSCFEEAIRPTAQMINLHNLIVPCKQKKGQAPESNQPKQQQENQGNYSDILGPNQPPEKNWCEEVVVGVAGSMQVIAFMAPNWAVRSALVGVLEALKQRGIKCCQAGGFWKACVAPITRKWREWNKNKERGVLPNTKNLPLYIE